MNVEIKTKPYPCENCPVKMIQKALYDEVICFRDCLEWQRWRREKDKNITGN